VPVAAAIGFSDEMRVGLRGMVRRVWAPRGVKVQQAQALVYTWRYLAVALNGHTGMLHWAWLPSMKKEGIAHLVADWQATGVAALVWDGAAAHRARVVRAVGLPLITQPPASPELNPPERLFQELRRHLEGRSYPDLDTKIARADAFLRDLAGDADRLRSLTGWAWIAATLAPVKPFPAPS
jgi:hypothetical protein